MKFRSSNGTPVYDAEGFVVEFVPAMQGGIFYLLDLTVIILQVAYRM